MGGVAPPTAPDPPFVLKCTHGKACARARAGPRPAVPPAPACAPPAVHLYASFCSAATRPMPGRPAAHLAGPDPAFDAPCVWRTRVLHARAALFLNPRVRRACRTRRGPGPNTPAAASRRFDLRTKARRRSPWSRRAARSHPRTGSRASSSSRRFLGIRMGRRRRLKSLARMSAWALRAGRDCSCAPLVAGCLTLLGQYWALMGNGRSGFWGP